MSVRMLQARRLRELAGALRKAQDDLNDRYTYINTALDLADRGYGSTYELRGAAEGASAWAAVLDDRAAFAETHDPFAGYPVNLMQQMAPTIANDPTEALAIIRSNFDALDQAAGRGGDDDVVGYGDLEAAADPANGFPPEVQAAARYLLDNDGLLRAIDIASDDGPRPDERFTLADIDAFIEQNGHLEVVITNFEALDIAADGGHTDGHISYEDLRAAAADTSLPAAVRESAQYLVDHPQVVDMFEDQWYADGLHRDRTANAVLHRLQPVAEEAWDLLWPPAGLPPEQTAELFGMIEGDDVSDGFRDELYVHIATTQSSGTLEHLVRHAESGDLEVAIASNAPTYELRTVVQNLATDPADIQAHRPFVATAIDNMAGRVGGAAAVAHLERVGGLESTFEALVIDHEEEDEPGFWERLGDAFSAGQGHIFNIRHEYDTTYLEGVLARVAQIDNADTKGMAFRPRSPPSATSWRTLPMATTSPSTSPPPTASPGTITPRWNRRCSICCSPTPMESSTTCNGWTTGRWPSPPSSPRCSVPTTRTTVERSRSMRREGPASTCSYRLSPGAIRTWPPGSTMSTRWWWCRPPAASSTIPHAEHLGYAGGAISQAIHELQIGDEPEGVEAVKLILGVAGLADPTKVASGLSVAVDAIDLLGTELSEADIEAAEGEWQQLEGQLYWALLPAGADRDTSEFPEAFDDFRIAYGNAFDRSTVAD